VTDIATISGPLIALGLIGGIVLFIPILKQILDIAPYMYTNAKVRALEAGLIKKDKLEGLADTKDILECVSSLEDTDYGPWVSKISEPILPEKVDYALNDHLQTIYKKVIRSVPPSVASVFQEFLRFWDARNITFCLRAIKADLPIEDRKLYVADIGILPSATIKSLMESKNMEEAISQLESTDYGPIISNAMQDSKKTESLLPIEVAIDKYVIEHIYSRIASTGEPALAVALQLLGTRADLTNLKTAIRCKKDDIDEKVLESYIIDVKYHLTEDKLKSIIKADNIEEISNYLENTPYSFVSQLLAAHEEPGAMLKIERALDDHYAKSSKELSQRYPLGIAPALNLLVAKRMDIREIKAVVRMKAEGFSKEELGSVLE
jgi:V/A-type H+-transporting ATPase subunit C